MILPGRRSIAVVDCLHDAVRRNPDFVPVRFGRNGFNEDAAKEIAALFDKSFPESPTYNERRREALQLLAAVNPEKDEEINRAVEAIRKVKPQRLAHSLSARSSDHEALSGESHAEITKWHQKGWPELSQLATNLVDYGEKAAMANSREFPPVERLGLRADNKSLAGESGKSNTRKPRALKFPVQTELRQLRTSINQALDSFVDPAPSHDMLRQHVLDAIYTRAIGDKELKKNNAEIQKAYNGYNPARDEPPNISGRNYYMLASMFLDVNQRMYFANGHVDEKAYTLDVESARELARKIRDYCVADNNRLRNDDGQPQAKRQRTDEEQKIDPDRLRYLQTTVIKGPRNPPDAKHQQLVGEIKKLTGEIHENREVRFVSNSIFLKEIFDKRASLGNLDSHTDGMMSDNLHSTLLNDRLPRKRGLIGKLAVKLEELDASINRREPEMPKPGVDWDKIENGPLNQRREKAANQPKTKRQIEGQSSILSFFSAKAPNVATLGQTSAALPADRGLERPSRDQERGNGRSI